MNKKTTLSLVISSTLGVSSIVSADMINFTYSATFTLADANGVIQNNSDAPFTSPNYGFYTEVTGSGQFDTDNGTGSYSITPFSFFGSGLVAADSHMFSSIGDGVGGAGNLIGTTLHFAWNGNDFDTYPDFLHIQDASGFLDNLPSPGQTITIGSDCVTCATSATADWGPFGTGEDTLGGSIGAVPIAMTNYNSAFPLIDDGVAGIPMLYNPFPGQNMGMDFTSITATNISAVPIPSAVWLFGSGLISLIGLARRKKA